MVKSWISFALVASAHASVNLVPSEASKAPMYWCTWLAQSRTWLSGASGLSDEAVKDYWRARTHEDWMTNCNQSMVFENSTNDGQEDRTGWAWLYPRARKDMFLMFDNGWQKGAEPNSRKLLWDDQKWPMFASNSSDESMAKFASYIREQGWKGAGLWVNGGGTFEEEQLRKLHNAGVRLLKWDGGDSSCDITALARKVAPDLMVEHATCGTGCPLNTGAGNGTRWSAADAKRQAGILQCTDLLRTYDMVKVLSISECLDRQAQLILQARQLEPKGGAKRLFGGSGEPSVTAALGGAIQPMRSNLRGLPPLPDAFKAYVGEWEGGRQRQHREDEIERLARWARIAEPFGVGISSVTGEQERVKVDPEGLYDSWTFALADDAAVISHHLENKTVRQGAPARVTRGGLPLPFVEASEGKALPFVIATRFPTGPVSITTLGRTDPGQFEEPKVHVTQVIPSISTSSPSLVGVFGYFEGLSLNFVVDAAPCENGTVYNSEDEGNTDLNTKITTAESAAACSERCDQTTGCACFSWMGPSAAAEVGSAEPGCDAPTIGDCVSQPGSFQVLPDVESADECCEACFAREECGWWVLRTNTTLNPGCHLKPAGAPEWRKDPLCTSGIGSAAPPSPPPSPAPTPPSVVGACRFMSECAAPRRASQYVSGVPGCAASKGADFGSSSRVLAQDLASEVAVDISARVFWAGSTLTLPGSLIEEIGTAARSRVDDASPPGLVLRIEAVQSELLFA